MTQKGDPYENALAERMNGIIKGEFNLYTSQQNFEHTRERVIDSITAYNQIRPHGSCDYLTPGQAHQTLTPMKKRWKNYPRSGTRQEAGPAPTGWRISSTAYSKAPAHMCWFSQAFS
jgi:hypothetical protein